MHWKRCGPPAPPWRRGSIRRAYDDDIVDCNGFIDRSMGCLEIGQGVDATTFADENIYRRQLIIRRRVGMDNKRKWTK